MEELLGRVRRRGLAVLFGQSGLGKTSLVQAGLFPRLREERLLPVWIHLAHQESDLPPAAQVLGAIAAALAMVGFPRLPPVEPGETLWERLHRRDCQPRDAEGEPVSLVLVFDQFEELFTLGRNQEARGVRSEEFIGELAALIGDFPPPRVEAQFAAAADAVEQYDLQALSHRVLFSLREDYLATFETLKERIPAIMQNRMALLPMHGAQALSAVLGPGREVIGEAVARQVVAFVAGPREGVGAAGDLRALEIAPALLSLMCAELNTRRLERGLPEISGGLLEESSDRILDDFYERCLADQPAGVRVLVEDTLLNDAGHRESISLDRARKILTAEGAEPGAIEEMVRRRLLRLEERHQVQRVEITHDVLTGVIRKSALARHERLQREEAERRRAGEEHRRREAEALAAEAQRKFRIMFVLAGGAVAALVVAVLLGVQSRRNAARAERAAEAAKCATTLAESNEQKTLEGQRRLAEQEQRAREAAVDSLTELGRREVLAGQPLRALPCLAEALRYGAERPGLNFLTGRALGALDSLTARCEGHTESVTFALFSPDGTRVATGSPDATARIWDAASGRLLLSLEDHFDSITAAAFSPDGTLLAVSSRDGDASLYELPGGKRRHLLHGHSLTVNAIAFSPDGALVATAGADATAALWQVSDGQRQRVLTGHGKAVQSVAFSPDGRRLVTASADGTARLWTAADGAPGPVMAEGGGALFGAEFDGAGARLLTACTDGAARIWDAATGKLAAKLTCGSSIPRRRISPPAALRWSWPARMERCGSALRTDAWSAPCRMARRRCGMRGLVRMGDGWSPPAAMARQSCGMRAAAPSPSASAAHAGALNGAAFSPEGRRVVTAGADRTARLWSLDRARVPRLLSLHTGPLEMAAYSPDGQRAITASRDGTARLWDPRTGAPVGAPLSHEPFWVLGSAWSSDGATVATVGGPTARLLAREGWHARARREWPASHADRPEEPGSGGVYAGWRQRAAGRD